ncbi:hypothetical protein [Candidatus Berkiella aquae]|uniref:Uncharacterized protein n=1 Tax=Candidatus Berkiella aquae TaxID=295108 RepID=A0A0Q9YZM4_9GAMM|nr:hypothetical protein [Candidatus Berkiella aquae]MCS5712151.1 hypothetical protein [Candidatus Berkiella aquae]
MNGAAVMVGKYNLFNLMGSEPESKLKHILATVDIDYQQYFPAGASHEASKEAVLTHILSSLHTSKKIITFKHLIESNFATDQNVIQEQNLEKNIEQIRIIAVITKKLLNTILEEAINNYLTQEQIKHLTLALHEFMARYHREKDDRLKVAYESEIQRIMSDQIYQKNLERIQQGYLERIKEHDNKIDHIHNRIKDIKEQKQTIVNETITKVGNELADHTAKDSDLLVYQDVISAENRDAFLKDFLLAYYQAEKEELRKYTEMDKADQAKVSVQLPSLINYHLARNNNKNIHELAKKEPDFEKIFIDVALKHNAKLHLMTHEQIKDEASLLAGKFKPIAQQMIHDKKEKIMLQHEHAHIEKAKQHEISQFAMLQDKLGMPADAKFNKTPASLEFDDFLSTVEIKPKMAMR